MSSEIYPLLKQAAQSENPEIAARAKKLIAPYNPPIQVVPPAPYRSDPRYTTPTPAPPVAPPGDAPVLPQEPAPATPPASPVVPPDPISGQAP
jgi:hypothetical protein